MPEYRAVALQNLQEGEDTFRRIIVSAYGDMTNIRTAINRGAFDFVTKPIDFLDLKQQSPKPFVTSSFCAKHVTDRRRQSGHMPRCHDIFLRTLHNGWFTTRIHSTWEGNVGRSHRCSPTLKVSRAL